MPNIIAAATIVQAIIVVFPFIFFIVPSLFGYFIKEHCLDIGLLWRFRGSLSVSGERT